MYVCSYACKNSMEIWNILVDLLALSILFKVTLKAFKIKMKTYFDIDIHFRQFLCCKWSC